MESIDVTNENVVSCGEYSEYSLRPSEISVELIGRSLSNLDLQSLAEALSTAHSGSEYSVYSSTPSQVDIELDDFDFSGVSESDVMTALSILGEPESDVQTAKSINSASASNSFLEQASFYARKSSTTAVEIEEDLIGQASLPLSTAAEGSVSWISNRSSETDCEVPFTFQVGNATVVDSNEVIYLKKMKPKPVEFNEESNDFECVEKNAIID